MNRLEHLDEIAREAFEGNYKRTGVLSSGELLYVALASGRMRELCPSDSEMMDVETPDLFRTVANECRATYVVSVIGRCRCSPISFR